MSAVVDASGAAKGAASNAIVAIADFSKASFCATLLDIGRQGAIAGMSEVRL